MKFFPKHSSIFRVDTMDGVSKEQSFKENWKRMVIYTQEQKERDEILWIHYEEEGLGEFDTVGVMLKRQTLLWATAIEGRTKIFYVLKGHCT